MIPVWNKIAQCPQRLTTCTFEAERVTAESFTHAGDSDSLHANPRKIKLHSPKYHRSCPDFFGAAGPTVKLTATWQHTCLCSITKMTPKPHPNKPGVLIQALHCPAPKLYWSTVCPGCQMMSLFQAGQDPLSPVLRRGSQSELHCLLSSPPRCCCKSKETLSYLPVLPPWLPATAKGLVKNAVN